MSVCANTYYLRQHLARKEAADKAAESVARYCTDRHDEAIAKLIRDEPDMLIEATSATAVDSAGLKQSARVAAIIAEKGCNATAGDYAAFGRAVYGWLHEYLGRIVDDELAAEADTVLTDEADCSCRFRGGCVC